jgi:fumarate hydratase class I
VGVKDYHDVRVMRLPRHRGSLPISLGVSCSADHDILGRIGHEGVFMEELDCGPARCAGECGLAGFS